MQTSKLRNIALVILGTIFLAACTSKTIQPPDLPIPSGNLSFKSDVVPVFTKSCALASCHASGFQQPDLTPSNAYKSLFSMSLVDTIQPDQSALYKIITPGGIMNTYLPSAFDQQTILYWIKQGAKNN